MTDKFLFIENIIIESRVFFTYNSLTFPRIKHLFVSFSVRLAPIHSCNILSRLGFLSPFNIWINCL